MKNSMEFPSVSGSIKMQFRSSFKWELVVTSSISRGRNVLNFPREYTRNCLMNSDRKIYLIDVASGRVYNSKIFTSGQNKENRYVYSCWKKFVTENNLKFRDKVIFNATTGDNVIQVQILRRRRRSR
ncbi:uncharacterized protein LOC123899872 [Trifolium pratense]|uniref:uncharacterized protein LOC123899872 n=1 Tax=Trifolium pratense TaxID=57577 RepID=UPI001E694E70|nr:uncharacterized protein LOC123899872 [Trifolium pratense]